MNLAHLFISADDYAYIQAAVKRADSKEVGGLGVVEIIRDDEGNVSHGVVRHMRLLRQEVSSSEVDWDDAAHAEWLEWLYTPEDQDGAGWTESEYGLYSWHSHGSMSTFYSGTDEDFIKKVGRSVPYVFSSVFNNRNQSTHRLDVFTGLSLACPLVSDSAQVTWKDANLTVIPTHDVQPILDEMQAVEARIDEQIKIIEAARDERIKEIKDEAEAQIKPLKEEKTEQLKAFREVLKDSNEEIYKSARDRMNEDWKEFVKHSFGGFNRNGGKSTGNSRPASSPSSQGSSGASGNGNGGRSGNAGSAGGTASGGSSTATAPGAEDQKESDPAEKLRKHNWYQCYDSDLAMIANFSLADIIKDMQLILMEEIPDDILGQLKEEEIHMIASRPSRDDEDIKSEIHMVAAMSSYGMGWL